jgi:hypothetical protein
MSNARRNLLLGAGAVVIAYVLLVVFWALQPLDDAVPIGKNEDNVPQSQTVECNTLFDSSVRPDQPLPTLDALPAKFAPYEYNRTACHAVQRDARRIFALDTVIAVLLTIGLVLLALRQTQGGPPAPLPPAPSSPTEPLVSTASMP